MNAAPCGRKAAGGVEVKRVIAALCGLLAAAGVRQVPAPDTFRRAKFGAGAEVEDQLWWLLANILQKIGTGDCEKALEQQRRLVVSGLREAGYFADWMGLGEGSGASSRDLLLALGWMLATGALEALLTLQVHQLDKTLLAPLPVLSVTSQKIKAETSSLRRLQWLMGRLRHQGRTLLSMQGERARLLHEVLSARLPSPASASSLNQSSSFLTEHCASMRQLCDLFEAYLNWRHEEKIFWTWMDSVMDCQVKDQADVKPTLPTCEMSERLETMRLAISRKGERKGRGVAEDIVSHPYRARLRADRPGGAGGSAYGESDEPEASQAVWLLRETEARLTERRDAQRAANRMRLQEMIGGMEKLLLIPP